jgi:hypothetical protein
MAESRLKKVVSCWLMIEMSIYRRAESFGFDDAGWRKARSTLYSVERVEVAADEDVSPKQRGESANPSAKQKMLVEIL